MTRKYYRDGGDVCVDVTTVKYTCPNTKEKVTRKLKDWELYAIEDRLGCSVYASYVECKSCSKKHNLYLRSG